MKPPAKSQRKLAFQLSDFAVSLGELAPPISGHAVCRRLEPDGLKPSEESFGKAADVEVRGAEECLACGHPSSTHHACERG